MADFLNLQGRLEPPSLITTDSSKSAWRYLSTKWAYVVNSEIKFIILDKVNTKFEGIVLKLTNVLNFSFLICL